MPKSIQQIETTNHDIAFNDELARIISHENEIHENEKMDAEMRSDLKNLACQTKNVSEVISDSSKVLAPLAVYLQDLGIILQSLPWISSLIALFAYLMKAIVNSSLSDKHPLTRIFKVGSIIALLSLTVISFTQAIYFIPLIELSHHVWDLGDLLISRYFGSWKQQHEEIHKIKSKRLDIYNDYLQNETKLRETTNAEEKNYLQYRSQYLKDQVVSINKDLTEKKNAAMTNTEDLAKKVEKIISISVGIAGLFLLPVIPPLGIVLITVSAAYSLLDNLNLNPIKHLYQKFFGNPFAQKEPEKDFVKISEKLDKKREKQLNQRNVNEDSPKQMYRALGKPVPAQEKINATAPQNCASVTKAVNNLKVQPEHSETLAAKPMSFSRSN